MEEMLKEYDKKRDFSRTPEPPREPTEAGEGPLIFVIQMPAGDASAFDLPDDRFWHIRARRRYSTRV